MNKPFPEVLAREVVAEAAAMYADSLEHPTISDELVIPSSDYLDELDARLLELLEVSDAVATELDPAGYDQDPLSTTLRVARVALRPLGYDQRTQFQETTGLHSGLRQDQSDAYFSVKQRQQVMRVIGDDLQLNLT